MSTNNSQIALFGTEISAAMTGNAVLIGTLPVSAAILIIKNTGTVDIAVYVNGTAAGNLWKTFVGGESVQLDLRQAQGKAPNFGNQINTTFFGNGASGSIRIAYVYAQDM